MFPVRSTDLKGDVQRGKIEPREPQHRAAPAELPQSGPHMRAKPCHSPGNTTQCMKPQGHPTMEVPPKRPYPPLQKYSVRPKIMLDLLLWFLKYSRDEKYTRIYIYEIQTSSRGDSSRAPEKVFTHKKIMVCLINYTTFLNQPGLRFGIPSYADCLTVFFQWPWNGQFKGILW